MVVANALAYYGPQKANSAGPASFFFEAKKLLKNVDMLNRVFRLNLLRCSQKVAEILLATA